MTVMLDRVDRILSDVVSGRPLRADEARTLAAAGTPILPDLMVAARSVRSRRARNVITFSRSVFVPVTNICRDRCGYCTFRKDPDDPAAWVLSPDDVRQAVERAQHLGCWEVLFSLGDKPDVFPSVRERLRAMGYRSTLDYLVALSRMVVEEYGLFPHTNAGVFGPLAMRRLRPWNLSMGLMLETVSERLHAPGGPHWQAPDKQPAMRLAMLDSAGRQRVPFTTGLLVGIGETVEERLDTLFSIQEAHRRHGHVQEVIIQNFRAKPGTLMSSHPEPSLEEYLQILSLARLILGPEMNVQAPPNLSPGVLHLLLDAGINDWGGVSPLTLDFINPEMPWPGLERLRSVTRQAGLALRERLPTYPEYLLDRPGFVDPELQRRASAVTGPDGYVAAPDSQDKEEENECSNSLSPRTF